MTAVRTILEKARFDLGDQQYSYTAAGNAELLESIRTELGDTGSKSALSIGIPELTAQIRRELNDTDTTHFITVGNAALLTEIRRELEDTRTTRTAITASAADLTAQIRRELNDTASVAMVSVDMVSLREALRAELGDQEYDESAVTQEEAAESLGEILHYAAASGSGGEIDLSGFFADGVNAIVTLRNDAASGASVRTAFKDALVNYIAARCLEGEIEVQADVNRWKVFYDRYLAELQKVPAHWTDAELNGYIESGLTEIKVKRPDAVSGNKIAESFVNTLKNWAAFHAVERMFGKEARAGEVWKVNYESFQFGLNTIPYHYQDTEISGYLTQGVREIAAYRPDAAMNAGTVPGSLCAEFENALKRFCVFHALERRFGRAAEAMELWKVNQSGYQNDLKEIPYHWTDTELNSYIASGIVELSARRPEGVRRENEQTMVYEVFKNALYSWVIFHALERRFGKEAASGEKWKIHHELFEKAIADTPYHWTDAEIQYAINGGVRYLAARRSDALYSGGSLTIDNLRSEFENALRCSAVFTLLERKGGTGTSEDTRYKIAWERCHADLQTLPYHWTDAELSLYLTEAVNQVKSFRSDTFDESGNIRSDLKPLLIYYTVNRSHDRNTGKGEAAAVWKTALEKYSALLKTLPAHWTDAELLSLLHDAIADILRTRPDARMDDHGNEIRIERHPEADDLFPLSATFEKPAELYIAAQAETVRPNGGTASMERSMLFRKQYGSLITGAAR